MKKYLILLALIFAKQDTAQTWYHNLEKYWWYRYRVVNDFMVIADECSPGKRKGME